uniref:Uncharacterized protein n=1 Tax=Caenorhabditis japonica TaxID=281687 RepID=A0A8R1DHL1_CAEJA
MIKELPQVHATSSSGKKGGVELGNEILANSASVSIEGSLRTDSLTQPSEGERITIVENKGKTAYSTIEEQALPQVPATFNRSSSGEKAVELGIEALPTVPIDDNPTQYTNEKQKIAQQSSITSDYDKRLEEIKRQLLDEVPKYPVDTDEMKKQRELANQQEINDFTKEIEKRENEDFLRETDRELKRTELDLNMKIEKYQNWKKEQLELEEKQRIGRLQKSREKQLEFEQEMENQEKGLEESIRKVREEHEKVMNLDNSIKPNTSSQQTILSGIARVFDL